MRVSFKLALNTGGTERSQKTAMSRWWSCAVSREMRYSQLMGELSTVQSCTCCKEEGACFLNAKQVLGVGRRTAMWIKSGERNRCAQRSRDAERQDKSWDAAFRSGQVTYKQRSFLLLVMTWGVGHLAPTWPRQPTAWPSARRGVDNDAATVMMMMNSQFIMLLCCAVVLLQVLYSCEKYSQSHSTRRSMYSSTPPGSSSSS